MLPLSLHQARYAIAVDPARAVDRFRAHLLGAAVLIGFDRFAGVGNRAIASNDEPWFWTEQVRLERDDLSGDLAHALGAANPVDARGRFTIDTKQAGRVE